MTGNGHGHNHGHVSAHVKQAGEASAAAVAVASGRHPRPLHFLCREDGSFVPLIAADELPRHVQLVGVPRKTDDITSVIGMISLGVIPSSGGCYSLETSDDDQDGQKSGEVASGDEANGRDGKTAPHHHIPSQNGVGQDAISQRERTTQVSWNRGANVHGRRRCD